MSGMHPVRGAFGEYEPRTTPVPPRKPPPMPAETHAARWEEVGRLEASYALLEWPKIDWEAAARAADCITIAAALRAHAAKGSNDG